jgi:hypothetical protein
MTVTTLARPVSGPRRATGIRLTGIAHRTVPPGSLAGSTGEALLAVLPDLDVVLLASRAGCQVARRGASASAGPAGAFAALRIADGLCRRGELGRGALFVQEDAAAVVLRLGVAGEVAVTELDEVPARAPSLALADLLYRHPGIRVCAGPALARRLAGTPYADRLETAGGGVWAALARMWPVRDRVLLADYEAGVLHSCVVVRRSS